MLTTLPEFGAEHALFLDFDGTLVAIQDNPDTVVLPDGGADILSNVAAKVGGALALVSGRDIRDLSSRVPETLWRAGGHGLDICEPGEAAPHVPSEAPEGLMTAVERVVTAYDGVRIEDKGAVLAVHYRQAPHAGEVLEAGLIDALAVFSDYKVQHGKMVIEAKPLRANKGKALETLCDGAPFAGRIPIMVGDDTTDEDAMRVARAAGGIAIKVGTGPTVADFRVIDPSSIWAWLERGQG